MIQFRINIALEGRHYCTVTKNAGPHSRLEVLRLLADLHQRFPTRDGFRLEVTEIPTVEVSYSYAAFVRDCEVRGLL